MDPVIHWFTWKISSVPPIPIPALSFQSNSLFAGKLCASAKEDRQCQHNQNTGNEPTADGWEVPGQPGVRGINNRRQALPWRHLSVSVVMKEWWWWSRISKRRDSLNVSVSASRLRHSLNLQQSALSSGDVENVHKKLLYLRRRQIADRHFQMLMPSNYRRVCIHGYCWGLFSSGKDGIYSSDLLCVRDAAMRSRGDCLCRTCSV